MAQLRATCVMVIPASFKSGAAIHLDLAAKAKMDSRFRGKNGNLEAFAP